MTRKIAGVLGRCLLAALGAFVGLMLGGALIRVLQLPFPTLPAGAGPTQLLVMQPVGAFFISLLLFPLVRRLQVPMAERATVVFLALWGVQGPLVAAEAFLFTTYGGEGAQLVSTATSAVALAVLLAALFPPRVVDRRLLSELRAWLATRPPVL
jgi:hypothetical protein